MMNPRLARRIATCLIFVCLASRLANGEDQKRVEWAKEATRAETKGMRIYAWAMLDAFGTKLERASERDFPLVRVFMRDFRAAHAKIDPELPPSEWQLIDVDALAIRNPAYWGAVYEIRPADPAMMWFHSMLYAVNGQAHRTFYSQELAVRSPVDTRLRKELFRLIASASRIIDTGGEAVRSGVDLFDQGKHHEAAEVYHDVLSVVPTHALALYEVGFFHKVVSMEDGVFDDKESQPYYDAARKADPFMIEAYQGSFSGDEVNQLMTLRHAAKPSWEELLDTPFGDERLEQIETLSIHLQGAGLHDWALLTRQLVVAHRENAYNESDRLFIATSLRSLLPNADLEPILGRLNGEHARLRVDQSAERVSTTEQSERASSLEE